MLVLSRHRGERIIMSNGVVVTVIDIYKDTVRLGFDAPADVRVDREEASLSRDDLGRIVREAWVRWASQQPEPRPGWLIQWPDLNEADREVDRLIGEAVVAAIEPPRPAVIIQVYAGSLHAFEDANDACKFEATTRIESGYARMMVQSWVWHPKPA